MAPFGYLSFHLFRNDNLVVPSDKIVRRITVSEGLDLVFVFFFRVADALVANSCKKEFLQRSTMFLVPPVPAGNSRNSVFFLISALSGGIYVPA